MADKVFGADYTNDTAPVSTYTISVNNGTTLVDVTLANLRKGMPVAAIYTSTSSPTSADDVGDGYNVGDLWVNTSIDRVFIAVDVTLGAAIWRVINELSTHIEGLKILWNSATSLSIGLGSCYAENGDFIDVTSTLTASSLSLSASTWYYMYVYLSAGSPALEVVTTAPAAWKGIAYRKTGDTSRRFVGAVRTDGSGNVYEFKHIADQNLILYSGSTVVGGSPFRALTAGTATTATEVSLASTIPATIAKVGFLRLFNLADKVASFGDTSAVNGVALNVGNTAAQNAFSYCPLTSTPGHYYKMASAVGAGGAYIDVYGYLFDR